MGYGNRGDLDTKVQMRMGPFDTEEMVKCHGIPWVCPWEGGWDSH